MKFHTKAVKVGPTLSEQTGGIILRGKAVEKGHKIWYDEKNEGGIQLLSNRMIQFREYNGLSPEEAAAVFGIEPSLYNDYESGRQIPDIDTVKELARFYKVTVDEFYGYSPVLQLHDSEFEKLSDGAVSESTLRMSDLSWDEKELLHYYRKLEDKESFIKNILSENFSSNDL